MGVLSRAASFSAGASLFGALSAAPLAAESAPMPLDKAAAMFGARVAVAQMSLSPDGRKIAYVGAAAGQQSVLVVGDMVTGDTKPITYSNNKPLNLWSCGWSAEDRLVCQSYGSDLVNGLRVSYTRLFAIDPDGRNLRSLGAPLPTENIRVNQFDGEVIDWLDTKGSVLMARDHVPGQTTGTLINHGEDGIGVDLVDTRTARAQSVERPRRNIDTYLTDGKGHVRMLGEFRVDSGGVQLTGEEVYRYRDSKGGNWQAFSTVDVNGKGSVPIAIDAVLDAAYVLKGKDGRKALYRVTLDAEKKEELLVEHPRVDVEGVLTLRGHVIGAYYTAERQEKVYFDPIYKALAEKIGRALPATPLIDIVDASADENDLLIRASSDTDEGRFYILNRKTHALQGLQSVRPEAEGVAMASVRPITYRSFDGTDVPAYLTLPPGSSGKNLPALVMPHGGPGARDVWGFDWLAQFFATRGFAVLQPEFRGSTGYGESWFLSNGFRSWKTSVGDVNAAGRWLVSQGIARPSQLAIFGWSYGGYAALQANVLDPDLFKAIVAVAPVTDLFMLRHESEGFTNDAVTKAFIGSGSPLEDASPDRHAALFKAPVLLFHGTTDINVNINESEAMNSALRKAGKQVELIRYPGLDHQLPDSAARADMLRKADIFLRKAMAMAPD